MSTGLTGLNNLLGGLHKSDLVILAGRPAMGKTALATNIAFHAATTTRQMRQPFLLLFSLWKCQQNSLAPVSWLKGLVLILKTFDGAE